MIRKNLKDFIFTYKIGKDEKVDNIYYRDMEKQTLLKIFTLCTFTLFGRAVWQ